MLNRMHPLPKLVICMVWILLSTAIYDAPFQALTILFCTLALVLFGGVKLKTVLLLMVPFALFGFGFVTTSLIFRSDADFALVVIGEAPISTTALSAGLTLFLRAIAGGMISALFALTTDPADFVKSLMVYWRLPARMGYAIFAAVQMVPDLASEAQQIRIARAMKKEHHPRRFPTPLETASLVVPLLAFAIRRAGRTAIAMEARGIGGKQTRTFTNVPTPKQQDIWFTLLALGMIGTSLLPVAFALMR